jgi:hypothetical protein
MTSPEIEIQPDQVNSAVAELTTIVNGMNDLIQDLTSALDQYKADAASIHGVQIPVADPTATLIAESIRQARMKLGSITAVLMQKIDAMSIVAKGMSDSDQQSSTDISKV